MKNSIKRINAAIVFIVIISIVYIALSIYGSWSNSETNRKVKSASIDDVDAPYIVVNDNVPYFEENDITTNSFEIYSELDKYGRCGVAFVNVSKDTMPTEERGEIGNIKPTGWKQAKYEGYVNSNPPYLYNRCHLIAYCLTGKNDDNRNLITGTRYMNVEGMLPFEMEIVRYLNDYKKNHVIYRVTPVFDGSNMLASGVLMEAYSVEDKGKGIKFCVFVYNKQPGIEINYKTGESKIGETIVSKIIISQ